MDIIYFYFAMLDTITRDAYRGGTSWDCPPPPPPPKQSFLPLTKVYPPHPPLSKFPLKLNHNTVFASNNMKEIRKEVECSKLLNSLYN